MWTRPRDGDALAPGSREQAAGLATHIRETQGFTPDERVRLDAMTDAEIEQAARDDPDAQPASRRAVSLSSRPDARKTAGDV